MTACHWFEICWMRSRNDSGWSRAASQWCADCRAAHSPSDDIKIRLSVKAKPANQQKDYIRTSPLASVNSIRDVLSFFHKETPLKMNEPLTHDGFCVPGHKHCWEVMEEQTIKQHSDGNFNPENYPQHSRSTAQYPAFEKRSGRIFPQDPAAVIKCNHFHSKNCIFRAS